MRRRCARHSAPAPYELYLIGKEQGAGSKRQQAVFKLTKWLFDRADGARLTMPL